MAEAIGDQDRNTPDDDKIRQAKAAGEGEQRLTHGSGDRNEAVAKPTNTPRAQHQDTTGDALRNDQRQDGTSVQMSGTKTDRSHDDLGTPVNAPTPAEEKS